MMPVLVLLKAHLTLMTARAHSIAAISVNNLAKPILRQEPKGKHVEPTQAERFAVGAPRVGTSILGW